MATFAIPAEHKRLYEYIKCVLRDTRIQFAQFADSNRESQLDDADYAAALVLAFGEGDNCVDQEIRWGVRFTKHFDHVRWDPQGEKYTEAEARDDARSNGLPLVTQQVYKIDIEFPWEEVANPAPEPARLMKPSMTMVGKVYRVRVPGDERVYVAEVRLDHGRPRWAGSWSGFSTDEVEVIGEVDG